MGHCTAARQRLSKLTSAHVGDRENSGIEGPGAGKVRQPIQALLPSSARFLKNGQLGTIVMSMSPIQADQRSRRHTPGQGRVSQSGNRNLERLALMAALMVGVIAALVTGVSCVPDNYLNKTLDARFV